LRGGAQWLLIFIFLNALLKTVLSKQGQQSEKANPIARLQFRALHSCSLDFVSSRLRVFRDVRHSKSPRQMCSSFRDISPVEMSGTFSRGPFDDRLNQLFFRQLTKCKTPKGYVKQEYTPLRVS
jgi:hypothetical protein